MVSFIIGRLHPRQRRTSADASKHPPSSIPHPSADPSCEWNALKRRLEAELNGQRAELRHYYAQELLLRGLPSGQRAFGSIGIPAEAEWFAVMIIEPELALQTRFAEQDRGLMMFAIRNMLDELIPSGSRLPAVSNDQQLALLVFAIGPSQEAFKNTLSSWIREVQSALFRYLSLQVSIGVSRTFKELSKSSAAYQESVEALKFRIWTKETSVFLCEDLDAAVPNSAALYPERLEREWIEAVKQGERLHANLLLRELVGELFGSAGNPRMLELWLVRLLLTLLDHMRQWGMSAKLWSSYPASYIRQVLALRTADEAERWFRQVWMEPCLTTIEENMKSYKRNLLDQIVTMIREEYDTDLSLESVAGRLHYNPNYLSGLFNKEMHITFSEYLSKHRHDMACQWLIETHLPVKEIACKLQYKNSQNFIRSFRRSQGMTPGEYRMKYGRKRLLEEAVGLEN
ncbi:helix-turn-helix domain-containing protein [Paenibacillus konkukensis]|nr:AraC family transcriptional regulator [Paenibacillus konkukensis]